MSREEIAKYFSSETEDADRWISENFPIDFPSKEWVANMSSTYGKSVIDFLKVKEHMEQYVPPAGPGEDEPSEEDELKKAFEHIVRMHSAKHQLGNLCPGVDAYAFDEADDYFMAPSLAEDNQFLKLKGIFAMSKKLLERELSSLSARLRKLRGMKRQRPGSTGSSNGNISGAKGE